MKKRIITFIIALAVIISCIAVLALQSGAAETGTLKGAVSYMDSSEALETLMERATSFIVVKHAPLGGSHYAYTEGLYEESTGDSPEGTESVFNAGSSLVMLTLEKDGDRIKKTEYTLLESKAGVIRDPDVSPDGKRIVFSWRNTRSDDFHLYEMDIATQKTTQLTYGSGVADTEPQYLANGEILFSSSRAVQTVDCWKTPVSNLYKCSADGSNIIRLGYDQVHTTYPTTTKDGRVIYTRWDYNDRTQMYIQSLFQMNADGTNQTELFANNSSFPTTLVHTRNVEGESDLYISIATGHHTYQAGKLVLLDLSKGRNEKDAVTFVNKDRYSTTADDVDAFGQQGALYQYPYAINKDMFLVSYCKGGWSSNKASTPFGIYLIETNGNTTELISGTDAPCANIIPLEEHTLFERPSMVDFSKNTGTYYVANVYEGEGANGIKAGSVKQIRVVALDYRPYAVGATVASGSGSADPFTPISSGNGSWDVKVVLGVATVYEDGSAMFKVPSEMPVYFQLLDENGSVIQTMRSWSTLMPGEIYSCVGCHEDKNTAPSAQSGVTVALTKGVEELKGEVWQGNDYDPYEKTTKGFDYLTEVQPILDKSCVSCHDNKALAYSQINASGMNNSGATSSVKGTETKIFDLGSTWKYKISASAISENDWNSIAYNDSSWSSGAAGFGDRGGDGANVGTNWSGSNNYIYLRKTFTIEDISKFDGASLFMKTWYDDTAKFYLNGQMIYSNDGWVDAYTDMNLGASYTKYLVNGTNVLAISINQHTGGRFIDTSLSFIIPDESDPTATHPISLESDLLNANRMKRYFPLSYLVLTGSKPNGAIQWVGSSSNKYTSWLSSMSGAALVKAGTFGSNQSAVIEMLRNGHGNLTNDEIRTISAWIDLCVPCYGQYDANNNWSSNDKKEAEEEQNKRDYYIMMNDYARMAKSNTLPAGTLQITYTSGSKVLEAQSEGIATLVTSLKFKNNDVIKIKLPDGVKYVGVTLNPKLGESIVYCPDGEFTYKITTAYLQNLFPSAISSGSIAYKENVITARIPTQKELEKTRNIAENVYDIQGKSAIYPHIMSDSEWTDSTGDVRFLARNAIDGFTNNKGHGKYPIHSWGPANSNNHNVKIDFGREVTVESIGIYIRYDAGHDTFFKSGVLKTSDGQSVNFTLEFVGSEQIIKLEKPIKTTSVTLEKLVADKSGGWAAISEIIVYGHD